MPYLIFCLGGVQVINHLELRIFNEWNARRKTERTDERKEARKEGRKDERMTGDVISRYIPLITDNDGRY